MIDSYNPLFYYPYEEEERNKDKVNNLYSPKEGLIKGNLFVNEYKEYKNYVQKGKNPSSEKEALMLDIMAYDHASHDLLLCIDVYPDKKDYVSLYEKYIDKLKELKEMYAKKYNPLCASEGKIRDGYFDYVTSPSPWLGVY